MPRDITIAELPATTAADDNSYIPIDNGDITYKIKVSDYNAGANATARAYAEAAGTSANSASASAGSAATYASNASQSAQDASNSADTALNHANNASSYANNAYEYAAAASTSASNATSQAQQVSDYAREAGEKSEDAEAFALGQRKGVDVDSEDATYQNNSKYYAEQAASNKRSSETAASSSLTSARMAEGYANGKQNGSAVPSSSEYYHNNAEYFSGLASDSANDASAAADRAESAVVKTPYIGNNNHWYAYDFSQEQYVNTGVKATGDSGADGITPTITAAASVDNTSGTPSVTVTKSGTNTNPFFAFNFSGLKGEPGEGGGTSYDDTEIRAEIDEVRNGIEDIVADKVENDLSAIDGIEAISIFSSLTLDIEPKYLHFDGHWVDASSAKGAILEVKEGEVYRITGSYGWNSALYGLYNANGNKLTTYPGAYSSQEIYETVTVVIPSGVVELRVSTLSNRPFIVEKQINTLKINHSFNVLDGKKWAVCGDSFTEGDFTNYVDSQGNSGINSDAYDENSGHYKTYPWWISNRNNMNIQWLAQSGADFTNIEGASNPFSASDSNKNYTQIANDCDYITIMYGLNETYLTTEQIGTKTDTTNATLWGAYNVVLTSILTANPTVKIGIIIADSWMNQTYHDALIDIANYWGIPYLDLKDGEQVPMMIGGKLRNSSPSAVSLRNAAFKCSESDSHPNVKAHKYRSTVIENFLRSL